MKGFKRPREIKLDIAILKRYESSMVHYKESLFCFVGAPRLTGIYRGGVRGGVRGGAKFELRFR